MNLRAYFKLCFNIKTKIKFCSFLIFFIFYLLLPFYKCLEDTIIKGPTFTLEPPKKVEFTNSSGVIIKCDANGTPKPNISWAQKDGLQVLEEFQNSSIAKSSAHLRHINSDGLLLFKPFASSNFKSNIAVYQCIASNSAGTIVSHDIVVTAVMVTKLEANVYDQFVISGNPVILKCHVTSNNIKDLIKVIAWIKDDSLVLTSSLSLDSKYTLLPNGDLLIKSVQTNEVKGNYRCKVLHKLTGEVAVSSSAGKVIVTEPHRSTPARITESLTFIRAYEGENIFLPCLSQGYPIPQMSWQQRQLKFQPSSMVSGDSRIKEFANSGLLIEKALSHHNGQYTCFVNNSVGTDTIDTEVKIYAPLSATLQPEYQAVDIGSEAVFKCLITGYPIQTVIWLKNGQALKISGRISLISKEVLKIGSIQRKDKGMYQCFVINEMETTQGSAQLYIGETEPKFIYKFEDNIFNTGSRISLKCGAVGNPLPQITWTLDDMPINEAYHMRIGDYVSDIYTVNSYINISSAKIDDGGYYRCIVKNTAGTVSHKARINVIGLPYIKMMPNITALSNQNVQISCPYSGYPIKSISWTRDEKRLPQNQRQKVFTNGTLIINELERSADAGKYECTVTDEQGHTAQGVVFISVMVSPVVEPFSFPNDLVVDRRAGVACIVSAGDLPIKISWMKDGQSLPDELGATITTNDFTSFLAFNQVTREHTGNYTCIAENPATKANYTAAMMVQVSPEWIIEPKDKSAIKGHSITFDCQSDGFPTPVIRWKKSIDDDFKVIISNANIQTLENGSLTIREVSEENSGEYMCQAVNGVGPGASTVIHLTVNVAPYFEKKFEIQTLKKGNELVMKCKAFGDKVIHTHWTRDRQRIVFEQEPSYVLGEHVHEKYVESFLEIVSVDRRDSALFTCTAENSFGKDSTNFQILVQEEPDCPTDVKASQIGSRSVTLYWAQPYSGNSPITNYLIEYKPKLNLNANFSKESVSSDSVNAIIKGLNPKTTYLFMLTSQNVIGQSEGCHSLVITTEEEAPSSPPRDVKAVGLSASSIQISWKQPALSDSHDSILGYYVGYQLESDSEFSFKTIEAHSSYHEKEETCQITGLRKLTRYIIVVQAFNKIGAGPLSDKIQVQTLEYDPPLPPVLRVVSVTNSSALLVWSLLDSKPIDPMTGFILFYRTESQDWEEVPIYGDQLSYNFINLQCGRKYLFYIIAFNSAGKGSASDIVSAQIQGRTPIAPEVQDLISPNSTFAILHLKSWKDGGCPIIKFEIKYKRKFEKDYLFLSNNIVDEVQNIIISDLFAASWYSILFTSFNEAGFTQIEYTFSTLTMNGDQIAAYGNENLQDLANRLKIVMPTICSIIVLIIILAVFYTLYRKRQNLINNGNHSCTGTDGIYDSSNICESMALNEWDNCKRVCLQQNSNDTIPRSITLENSCKQMTSDQIYFPSPYALSQLSVYERVGARTDSLRRQHTYDVPVKKVYLNTFSPE